MSSARKFYSDETKSKAPTPFPESSGPRLANEVHVLASALSAELRTTQRITEKCPAEGRARQGCVSDGSSAGRAVLAQGAITACIKLRQRDFVPCHASGSYSMGTDGKA